MKRTALALTPISTLLMLTVVTMQFANLGMANPDWLSYPRNFTVAIQSPINKTYSESTIPLNIVTVVDYDDARLQERWIGYSLDGQETVSMPHVYSGIANTTLKELSNGQHRLTVYAENRYSTKVRNVTLSAQSTVYFTVDTTPTEQNAFLTSLVVAGGGSVAVIGIGLLVYVRKRKH